MTAKVYRPRKQPIKSRTRGTLQVMLGKSMNSLVPNSVYAFVSQTRLRRGLTLITGLAVVTLFAVAVFKARADRAYYAGYDPSIPLDAEIRDTDDSQGFERIDFTFNGREGDAVPALMGLPRGGEP